MLTAIDIPTTYERRVMVASEIRAAARSGAGPTTRDALIARHGPSIVTVVRFLIQRGVCTDTPDGTLRPVGRGVIEP